MMKRLMMLLILSSAAFGQVAYQIPAIESQVPQPIAGLTGVVCLDTSTGTPCTPAVTVYSDKALSVPITTLTTDGDGMFPTFFIAPGQYQWCASDILGRISAYCTKFTAPAVNGGAGSFATLLVTGNSTLNGGTLNGTYGGNPALSGNVLIGGTLLRKIAGRTCYADQYTGADAGAKMIAAEADSSCSIVDATGFTGAQTGTSTVTATVPLILGAYTYFPSANPAFIVADQSALSGQGMSRTIILSTSNTADVIRVPSSAARWSIHDIQVSQPVTRSAGSALRISGGNGTISNIYIPLFFDGMFFDTAVFAGLNMVSNFYLGNATDSGTPHCGIRNGGVSSGTVSSNQFSNGAILENANYSDAMICIQDGSDTILFSNVQAVWDVVHAGTVAFHSELVNGGIEPYDIKFTNSIFEAGASANVMVFDSIRAFECINCSASGGLDGVRLNGGVTTGGGGEWQWIGGKISNNHAHGLDIESGGIGDITVIGTRFADNGQNTNNTFDDIFNVGAGNVQLIGNEFNKINSSAPPNNVKWNIEIAAGNCGNYTIVGNNYAQAGVSGTISNGCTAPKGISLDANSGTANIVSPSGMTFKGATSGGANIAAPPVAGTPSLVLPTVSGTFSLATAQDCGTTTTCSHTDISSTLKIVKGSAPLVSGTPSTATVTGFSPAFTSSSSFVCTATNATTQANSIKVVNASASSITLTGPNTVTDMVNYSCTGT